MWDFIHNAIVVTGREDAIHAAHRVARSLSLTASGMAFTANGYTSFLIAPSGIGKGGSATEVEDLKRKKFRCDVDHLDVSLVEVQYGCPMVALTL